MNDFDTMVRERREYCALAEGLCKACSTPIGATYPHKKLERRGNMLLCEDCTGEWDEGR